MKSKLCVLEDFFTIHRLSPDNEIPTWLFDGSFCHITQTVEEISVICSSAIQLDSLSADTGWSCIKVIGPLDLTLTGLLADILDILATKYILTQNFQDMKKLGDKEYCNKLVILTADIIKKFLKEIF